VHSGEGSEPIAAAELRKVDEGAMPEIFRKQVIFANRRRSRAEQTPVTALELVTTLGTVLAIVLAVALVAQIALRLSGQ
jgi:hypothetical protein